MNRQAYPGSDSRVVAKGICPIGCTRLRRGGAVLVILSLFLPVGCGLPGSLKEVKTVTHIRAAETLPTPVVRCYATPRYTFHHWATYLLPYLYHERGDVETMVCKNHGVPGPAVLFGPDGEHVFVLEERPYRGEEKYVVHTLDRRTGRHLRSRLLGSRLGPRLGVRSRPHVDGPFTVPLKVDWEVKDKFWHDGRLYFWEEKEDREEGSSPPDGFTVYDPLTGQVRPHWVVGGGQGEWARHVSNGLSWIWHNQRPYSLRVTDRSPDRCVLSVADVLDRKILWSQEITVEQGQFFRQGLQGDLYIRPVPGTDAVLVAWGFREPEPHFHNWSPVIEDRECLNCARSGIQRRPASLSRYRILSVQTGKILDTGACRGDESLPVFLGSTREGIVTWQSRHFVLLDSTTFQEIRRLAVPHDVTEVFTPHFGNDVWLFCTLAPEGYYLDVFSPGLREHKTSERLDQFKCAPSSLSEQSGGYGYGGGGFHLASRLAGVIAVGERLLVGPWRVSQTFDGTTSSYGCLFMEITREGRFAGNSYAFLLDPRVVDVSGDRDMTTMNELGRSLEAVEGSRMWLSGGYNITVIDWGGGKGSNPKVEQLNLRQ